MLVSSFLYDLLRLRDCPRAVAEKFQTDALGGSSSDSGSASSEPEQERAEEDAESESSSATLTLG